MREHCRLFMILLIFSLLIPAFSPRLSGASQSKKILILHSYHRELGWTHNITQGIDHILSNSGYPIETQTEYMDTKRIFDPVYLKELANLLAYKYRKKSFDLIISSDDHAFNFLRTHHGRIFKDIPIVFCGVNLFRDEFITGMPHVTGVVEAFGIEETLRAALTINPDLTQIFTVVDETVTGKANLSLLKEVIPDFSDRLTFTTLTKMEIEEVLSRVSNLPGQSAVLLMAFTSDRSGKTFSLEKSADLICGASNMPVYSFWDFHLNHGILGGMLTTGNSQGEAAAKLALKILGGESPGNIPVMKASPNQYIFDYNTMAKFKISPDQLPWESKIINQPVSFYQEHKTMVFQTLFIFGLLLAFSIIITISLIRARRAEAELKKSEERFNLAMKFANDGLFDWKLKTDQVYFSPGWKWILGYEDHEIPNKFSEWERLTAPEDVKRSIQMIQKLSQGELDRFENEFKMKHKDGHWVDILARANLVFNDQGEALRMVGTHVDITQRKQAEQALKDSQQRLFFLLQNTPIGVVSWDHDLRVVEWNPAAEHIFGYTKEEVKGRQIAEFILPGDQDDIARKMFSAKGGQQHTTENKTKTGRLILCDWYNTAIENDKGQVIGVASLVNDITERRHSEDINHILFAISNAVNTTRNLEELYHQVHTLLGKILDVTNFYIALVNTEDQTLHFPYFVDTVDDIDSLVYEFSPDKSLTGLVVSRRQPLLLKFEELTALSQKGSVVGPIPEIWMGVPIMIQDEVIGVIAVQSYTDPDLYTEKDLAVLSSISDQVAISIDRKRAEDELRESEKRYRHLFNHAPAGMFEIDFRVPRFVEVNSILCEYTGYSEEEFLSINPLDILVPESRQRYVASYEAILRGEEIPADVEYEITIKNGNRICVILNSEFIYEEKKMIGARVVVHDITERKRLEDMIIQSEKMMSVGGLAAGMAHEINNPLAGMMQNAQVIDRRLKSKLPANEATAEELGTSMAVITKFMEKRGVFRQLESIRTAGSRAAKIVENMLSFARQDESVKRENRIESIIDQTIEIAQNDYDLKKEYDFKDIKITRQYTPGIPGIFCEKSKLQQVFFNIIKNAAQEMSQNPSTLRPELFIRLKHQSDKVIIEIEDNGPGMDQETQKRIFEPFFTTKDVSKGTGLGLSVSYFIIVQEHKGKMEVNSVHGKGTTFIITLPINPSAITSDIS